jgi:hypothetical protein
MSHAQPPYDQAPQQAYRPPARQHPSAVPALVLGILSLVLCGLVTGIPAMIMGRRAIREIRASHGAVGGEGVAQGGFWTGLIGTVWTGAVTLFVILVFALGGVVQNAFEQTCTSAGGPSSTSQGNC